MISVPTRHAARGLILSQDNECLLIQTRLPWVDGPTWILPGGGIDPGESEPACVVRELFEETGLTTSLPNQILWRCDFTFQWKQKLRHIIETVYLVREDRFEPTMANMLDYELDWTLGFKWWSLDELKSSADNFSPRQFAQIVEQLLSDAPPTEALNITDPLPLAYRAC